jgi:CHAT domain-containing protein
MNSRDMKYCQLLSDVYNSDELNDCLRDNSELDLWIKAVFESGKIQKRDVKLKINGSKSFLDLFDDYLNGNPDDFIEKTSKGAKLLKLTSPIPGLFEFSISLIYQLVNVIKSQKKLGAINDLRAIEDIVVEYGKIAGSLKNDSLNEALEFFNYLLDTISYNEKPHLWARTKRSRASCFYTLFLISQEENKFLMAVNDLQEILNQSISIQTRLKAMIYNDLGVYHINNKLENRTEIISHAIKWFEQAEKSFREVGDMESSAQTCSNLGYAHFSNLSGDQNENKNIAIHFYEKAVRDIEKVSLDDQNSFKVKNVYGYVYNNLGSRYRELETGDPEENLLRAIDYHKKAMTIWCHTPKRKNECAEANNCLGLAYGKLILHGKHVEKYMKLSLHHFEKSLDIWTKLEDPIDWSLIYFNLGKSYFNFSCVVMKGDIENENFKASIRCFAKALTVRKKKSLPIHWAETMYELACVLQRKAANKNNKYMKGAIKCYEKASGVFNVEFPHSARSCSIALGDCYMCIGKLELAVEKYKLAEMADNIIIPQTISSYSKEKEIDYGSSLYFNGSWCQATLGNTESALKWLEKGKSRIMVEKLSLDAALLESIQSDEKHHLENLIAKIREIQIFLSSETSFIDFEKRNKKLGKRVQALNDLNEFLLLIQKKYNSSSIISRDFHLKNLEKLLSKEKTTHLIVINVTDFGSIVFTITIRDKICHKIHMNLTFKSSDMLKIVNQFLDQVKTLRLHSEKPKYRKRFAQKVEKIMADLFKSLFLDVLKDLDRNGEVIIVPHRALHALPFVLMNYRDDQGEKKYILEEFTSCSHVPSITSGLLSYKKTNHESNPRLVAICDTQSLKWARVEIEDIASHFEHNNSKLYHFPDASFSEMIKSIPESDYLHFACHAVFDPDDSYIEIPVEEQGNCYSYSASASRYQSADVKIEENQIFQRLSVKDIAKLRFSHTPVTLLSACESGMTKISTFSDEYIGLPAGFLLSGARNVVSSLWVVDDEATTYLMTAFYRFHFEEKNSISVALRMAQQKVRSVKKWENPFYWAAFIVAGLC